jgi:hypothetical protein
VPSYRGRLLVHTTAGTLARLLWRHGEDALWERAFALSPKAVADIGERAGVLLRDQAERERLWPSGPRDDYLLLAVIEALEGTPRPAVRYRRRPGTSMPPKLVVSEAELWNDPFLGEVQRIFDERERR